MNTAELTGAALDWAVAKCEGVEFTYEEHPAHELIVFQYSTDWAQSGPIIEQFEIDLKVVEEGVWQASNVFDDMEFHHYTGPTPLIAAMRCYVASKLGDEIALPDELMENTK